MGLVRNVPFEDLPDPAATYIAADAVLKFQTDYDGDTAKERSLNRTMEAAMVRLNILQIKNAHANFLDTNGKLARLKSTINAARRSIR